VPDHPEIVCICGSMRFAEEMRAVSQSLTLAGVIVLMPAEIGTAITAEQKTALSELHLRRIDVADRVVVVNRGEHFGESTMREVDYAHAAGKPVTFVGPAYGEA
jgi:nucleoside 2-deoxyribosyltransferase